MLPITKQHVKAKPLVFVSFKVSDVNLSLSSKNQLFIGKYNFLTRLLVCNKFTPIEDQYQLLSSRRDIQFNRQAVFKLEQLQKAESIGTNKTI